jgi:hypothetical protein
MRILVLYWLSQKNQRKTIDDHLFSFKRYDSENDYLYFNAVLGLPRYLSYISFDAVFLHYTFFASRWSHLLWTFFFPNFVHVLSRLKCLKIAFPQDEYAHTNELCRFFREAGVEVVFTCAFPKDYRKFYPEELSGVRHLYTTYTGFVDGETVKSIESGVFSFKPNPERELDIGYRARNLPYWLGRHGQLKVRLANAFLEKTHKYPDMRMDISTDETDVFWGKDWIQFLGRCRVVLGCLGGASLLDFNGEIRKKVEKYISKHPDASFDEVEKECFPSLDGNISLFTLSPRHFECAMTRTCQVLIEGDYHGVLRPNIDFIELKNDFSNIDEVIHLIRDKTYCSSIAENCYQKLIASGDFTYERFVVHVLATVKKLNSEKRETSTPMRSILSEFSLMILKISEKMSFIKQILFITALELHKLHLKIRKSIKNKLKFMI